MVKVFIEKTNDILEVQAKNISELVKMLDLNPETVLISKNNELIAENLQLEENDEIKFLSVISGG
jgi:sulfur carrier protein